MYMLTAALVVAGWAVVYIASRQTVKRACAELRMDFQRKIDSLSANVKAPERTAGVETSAGQASAPAATAQATSTVAQSATIPSAPIQPASLDDEITPEVLRTITETITALLGRKVRIRSVKVLQTPDPTVNSWAQQGRAVIQASHNFAHRGHDL